MPIYAYRCQECGFAKDVLQKLSDALLTECPSCKQASFRKQLTAAGFQLKGTGWYVTDFRGGASGAAPAASAAAGPASAETATASPAADKPATTAAPAADSKPVTPSA